MMRAFVVTIVAMLAGCALLPEPTHDEVVKQALPAGTSIPPTWKTDAVTGAVADDWLKSFNDPVLDAIVAEAMVNNLDLRQAAQRVTIAQQSVVVVGAQLLPQINGQLGAKTTHDFGNEKNVEHTFNSAEIGASVAWEIDVWGKLRAQRAASEASFQATALDYAYARQSLAATVAKSWYLTTETHRLLLLAEQAVKIYADLLNLVKIKRSAGKDTDLDVADASAKLETAQSQVEAASNAYAESRRALEVLLGRYPADEIKTAAAYPPLSPLVGAGVPSSLLERRPDIAAAESLVVAAFRQEESAKLALLPDFSISLVGERVSDHLLRQLGLSPWLASAGIGMFIPIYEGGALRAEVEIATAQQLEAIAHYGSVVLKAFLEVENVLANEQILEKRLQYERSALKSLTTAVQIANVQYVAGRRDLLWVEQLQAEQLAYEDRVIKLVNAQVANRIQLYLALGGSFDAPASEAVAIPPASGDSNDGSN